MYVRYIIPHKRSFFLRQNLRRNPIPHASRAHAPCLVLVGSLSRALPPCEISLLVCLGCCSKAASDDAFQISNLARWRPRLGRNRVTILILLSFLQYRNVVLVTNIFFHHSERTPSVRSVFFFVTNATALLCTAVSSPKRHDALTHAKKKRKSCCNTDI